MTRRAALAYYLEAYAVQYAISRGVTRLDSTAYIWHHAQRRQAAIDDRWTR